MKVDKTYEADKVRREPACSTRPCWTADQEAAPERTDAIRLKIVLMLAETPGSNAPAATAMKPARSAYSTRSWPRSSCRNREKRTNSFCISILLEFKVRINHASFRTTHSLATTALATIEL